MGLSEKQLDKLAAGREYRALTLSVRALEDGVVDDDQMTVEGYATTFNEKYLLYDWGDYRVFEMVDPQAFKGCDMSDVIMQYDHEGRVFARTKNGTLRLTVDSVGLKVVADLGGTEIGRQLYAEIKGGYTDKMSFGFIVAEDKRETVNDHETNSTVVTRTITKISKLFDVSAVSLPANDTTSISARRYVDGVISGIEAERLERARKRINLLTM